MKAQEKAQLDELISSLDYNLVNAAIRSKAPKVFDLNDYELIADMSLKAVEEWLFYDLQTLTITAIENKRSVQFENVSEPTSVICDIEAVNHKGLKLIIDWKSSSRDLDPLWEQRHRDSWQWRTYLRATNSDICEFRGINTKLKTRTVPCNFVPGLNEKVDLQYRQVADMRTALIGTVPWPRHMPGSCFAFGRPCPYVNDCRKDTYPITPLFPKSISHSAMDTFLLCPERYRRDELIKIAGVSDDTEDAPDNYSRELGSALHRSLAEIYRQAFKL